MVWTRYKHDGRPGLIAGPGIADSDGFAPASRSWVAHSGLFVAPPRCGRTAQINTLLASRTAWKLDGSRHGISIVFCVHVALSVHFTWFVLPRISAPARLDTRFPKFYQKGKRVFPLHCTASCGISLRDMHNLPTGSKFALVQGFFNFLSEAPKFRSIGGGVCVYFLKSVRKGHFRHV